MAAINEVNILGSYQVAPPSGSVSELFLPLTCADMMWTGIGMSPVHRLVFYDHSVSKSLFVEKMIPNLKNSLSLALKHFPSLAGCLIIPPDDANDETSKPEIRFENGNSVSLVFVESCFPDYGYFVSDQPRNCSEFYRFVPQVPQSTLAADGTKICPLLALQVTLFPEKGICIGYAYQHVAGDGSSMYAFINSWASICRSGEDNEVIPPNYDRLLVKNHTKELDDLFWKKLKIVNSNPEHVLAELAQFMSSEGVEKVRATFVIALEDIRRLKKHLSDAGRPIKHLSTFTVVCGYVWSCLVKSGNAIVDEVDEDELIHFICVADSRGRTDPIIPANYFGNCLTYCMTSAKKRQLSGDEGFLTAAELIGQAIHDRLHYPGGVLRGLETFFTDMSEVKNLTNFVSVAGSPRQNYYDLDLGWGKPRKVEVTSIDSTGAISITSSRDDSRVPEIGLALPNKKMDAFIEFFREGLL